MAFEKFRARRAEKQRIEASLAATAQADLARQHAERDLAAWTTHHQNLVNLIAYAKTLGSGDGLNIVLHVNERVAGYITGTGLVEDRVTGGHYVGGSRGISVPLGSIGGHTVRTYVGSSSGHYVKGVPTPTAIDTGTFYITNQRLVFVGAKKTIDMPLDKVVSLQRSDSSPVLVVSLSNHVKNIELSYGSAVAPKANLWLSMALAHHQGHPEIVVHQLEAELAALDAQKPVAPPTSLTPTNTTPQ